jgi:type III pantothenate kinase
MKLPGMKLLIDLGNTRLKWALWDGAELHSGGAIAHAGERPLDLDSVWQQVHGAEAAWVASVAAPALDVRLKQSLSARGISMQFVHSSAQACGVRNAYAQPERLGVDRFLSLIAAHANAREPTVIASCGTALTLDALAADGSHLGGLIAPAPDLMRAALLGHTARLGKLESAARIVERADNTADAVESGCWLAAAALIERFVVRSTPTLGAAPALVLSGGGATRLAELVALPSRIDSELVLRGLALFADHAS